MAWHANDLGKLGKMMDEMPNVYTEVGAVLYDIGRQPRAAHDFFVKYQDRILFGKDSFQPEEYPYYWRVFETKDDYFDYYRDYHAFWKLYGIDLPDAVLKKVYFQNALKLAPGFRRRGGRSRRRALRVGRRARECRRPMPRQRHDLIADGADDAQKRPRMRDYGAAFGHHLRESAAVAASIRGRRQGAVPDVQPSRGDIPDRKTRGCEVRSFRTLHP